jgi:hypothetical protein
MFAAALASSLTTGCIIPEAPEYGAARQTPVFVDESTVFPNPHSLQHYQNLPGYEADFRVSVRSEDAGEELISALYVDYKHQNGFLVEHKNGKPETFDKERVISWTLDFQDGRFETTPACHIFTLNVFHASGWDFDNNRQIGTPPDMASVSWFASFNDNGSALLSQCPDSSTESATTAGAP